MNRRDLLKTGAAAAAVAAMPAAATVIEPTIKPAWVIGTDGEYDWQHVTGNTKHEAILNYLDEVWQIDWKCETTGTDTPGCPDHEFPCEFCERYLDLDAQRMAKWDGLKEVTPADWVRAGMGAYCSRCSEEAGGYGHAHIVKVDSKEEVVCEDCMTISDWEQVNPKYAAELREDERMLDCEEDEA